MRLLTNEIKWKLALVRDKRGVTSGEKSLLKGNKSSFLNNSVIITITKKLKKRILNGTGEARIAPTKRCDKNLRERTETQTV